MMCVEFCIRYAGEGWLDIVEAKGPKAKPLLAPDLVVTRSA